MSKLQTLWYTRCPGPTPLGIAAQLNWLEFEFARDDIAVRSLQDVAESRLRQSHIDHGLCALFRQGGSIPAIWARSTGRQTRVIGVTWTEEAQLIFTRAEAKLRTVEDLKGKRLGVRTQPGSKIDFWKATTMRAYLAALQLAGLSQRDVTFVEIPSARTADPCGIAHRWPSVQARDIPEVKALMGGDVDVIFHKGSRGVEVCEAIGARVVCDLGQNLPRRLRTSSAPRTLTVDADLLDSQPDLAVRVLKLVLKAGEWAARHPSAAVSCIVSETGSSEWAVRKGYGEAVGINLGTELDEFAIEALNEHKNFLLSQGFLAGDFDVRRWIDPAPLAQAQRELNARENDTLSSAVRNAVGLRAALGALPSR